MKVFLLVLVSLIFFFLQITLVNAIKIGGVAPDFLMLLVVYLSLQRFALQGTIIGFIIGFIQDLFNPMLLGLNAMIKSIIGFIIGEVGEKTVTDSAGFMIFLFLISKLAGDMVYSIFYFHLDPQRVVAYFFSISVPSALYTAALGVLIHVLVKSLSMKMMRAFGKAK